MAEKLEGEELLAFLAYGTRTAKIAAVKRDGSPSVSPVWFILDQNDIHFTTMNTTAKYKMIARDPRVSICIDEEQFPYNFAVLTGDASIQQLAVDELLPWTSQIARRYVPEHLANQFGQRNAVEGEVLIRVKILKSFAYKGIAD